MKTLRVQMSVCTAAAALLLTAAGASAQTAPVSGAATGPGVSLPPAGPTATSPTGTASEASGSAGEATLASAFNRELPVVLPRTGGFPMPDPSLVAVFGAGLTGAGLYLRGKAARRS